MDLLWCDGTWSRPGARSAVSERLRRTLPAHVNFRYVDHPAAIGPVTGQNDVALAETINAGTKTLARAVAAAPGRVSVGGYSAGAMIAVRFCRDVLPKRRDLHVSAVATLGDPYQPVHGRGRYGIAGALSTPGVRRISLYVPGDPIADLPDGAPLRSLFDAGEWMSIRSPQAADRWAKNLLAKTQRGKLQDWWAPWRWADVTATVGQIQGYLGTRHTTDYIRDGHVGRLAAQIGAM